MQYTCAGPTPATWSGPGGRSRRSSKRATTLPASACSATGRCLRKRGGDCFVCVYFFRQAERISQYCMRNWKCPNAQCNAQDYLEEELSSLPAVNAAPVLVRGGLFEVDLERRTLNACYWPGPQHRVLRGTWFAEKAPDDWAPLQVVGGGFCGGSGTQIL